MNYTEWMIRERPGLKDVASSITFEYITRAKSQTKKHRVILNFILMSLLLFLASMLLSFYDLAAFESASWWIAYSVAVVAGIFISKKLEQMIIRKQLSEMIKDS